MARINISKQELQERSIYHLPSRLCDLGRRIEGVTNPDDADTIWICSLMKKWTL